MLSPGIQGGKKLRIGVSSRFSGCLIWTHSLRHKPHALFLRTWRGNKRSVNIFRAKIILSVSCSCACGKSYIYACPFPQHCISMQFHLLHLQKAKVTGKKVVPNVYVTSWFLIGHSCHCGSLASDIKWVAWELESFLVACGEIRKIEIGGVLWLVSEIIHMLSFVFMQGRYEACRTAW